MGLSICSGLNWCFVVVELLLAGDFVLVGPGSYSGSVEGRRHPSPELLYCPSGPSECRHLASFIRLAMILFQ